MKTGVIYARYSSDRQNEQSIAGQVDVCKKWADNNDIKIINVYHDEAITGKTDKRPAFQKMIRDAKSGKFEYVIVYKVDRFSRNRYDSAIYKAKLKQSGVKLLSAMENIADGPEGIILESVLEGMAEYYSANLAQNVSRGMRQRAEQGKFLGSVVPLGYDIDADKNFVINDHDATIVRRIFERYAAGNSMKKIYAELNAAGLTTNTGRPFTYNVIHRVLVRKQYCGIYNYGGSVIEGGIPRIIDDATFAKVQQRLNRNKHAPASAKATVPYYLTGKLFCGKCGSSMVGDSGTSRTGATHYYYTCLERKRKHGCTKKSVKKDWIEKLVTDITINQVLTDENIEYISKKAFDLYEKERTDKSEIIMLTAALRDTQKVIDNIMTAIEQGILTDTTKQRLMDAEERKKSLQAENARAEIKMPRLTAEQIEYFLHDIKIKALEPDGQIENIISTFVNAVYLYDDRIVIVYNYYDGDKQKKVELSDIANVEKFGFDVDLSAIKILSEPFVFVISIKLQGV